MKKMLILTCTLALSAVCFSSCNKIEKTAKARVTEVSYNFDINSIVDWNFLCMDAGGGTLEFKVNTPFEVKLSGSNASISKNGNSFAINIGDNSDDSAREIRLYITDYVANESIKGYGFFNYPVVIRQAGDKVSYLSGNDLLAMKENRVEWNDGFIRGIVKSVSDVYQWGGILRQPGNYADFYDFPICGNTFGGNVMSVDQTKPYDLEARDIIVESEGVQITVQAAWLKAYGLVGRMDVKAGDTVEIYADKRGVDGGHDKDILVNPLSVVVLK